MNLKLAARAYLGRPPRGTPKADAMPNPFSPRFNENPGHLEVGYSPRAPSRGMAAPGEPSKGEPFSREMWIERTQAMRQGYLRRNQQGLAFKDEAASSKLNYGCLSRSLLPNSSPYYFYPKHEGGKHEFEPTGGLVHTTFKYEVSTQRPTSRSFAIKSKKDWTIEHKKVAWKPCGNGP